ncbi:MAG: acyl-[ACP]--phospholipid O-acyltransferase [Magnetococcales bacterium]|nr:acyl-[ACP]--phospholipid O-acyltransferase [Magnetococcales bacterium]
MSQSIMELFKGRRFWPLFVTQFLGALNDNIFKNALVILITYRVAAESGVDGRVLVTVAAGVFILPFFLFSALAGQLSDKYEKSRIIQLVKLGEIAIMILAGIGFALGNPYFLLTVLFLMGSQSALFGPLKYGILPELLSREELVAGNALVEAGTFLAILIGTIAGGLLILADGGVGLVSVGVFIIAVSGWWVSRSIPVQPPAEPGLVVDPHFLRESWRLITYAAARRDLFLAILGISWFWLVGATFLAQFPTFSRDVLHGDQQVVTLLLTLFSVGIGLGSLLSNRLLQGKVDARHVPFGALGITLFSVDLYFASNAAVVTGTELGGAGAFLAHGANWRIGFDLFMIAISGGVYIVPLYALLQDRVEEGHRARIIAANNIMNALFMVVSAVAGVEMLSRGFSVPEIFLTMGLVNLLVAIYICGLLPEAILKALLVRFFALFYRVEVRGQEHLDACGGRAVIVVNHVSFLDAALLAAFLPGRPLFAINTQIAGLWWVKPFLKVVEAFAMDPGNPFATRTLARKVGEGRRLVIFPEGRITVTGSLMKIYEGPGLIADKADAPLLPIRIEGAQYTPLSRLKGKVRQRWFPKITLTILPPRKFAIPEELKGRRRRQFLGQRLYDLLTEMMSDTCNSDRTLFQAIQDARAIHGGKRPILEDVAREPMGYGRLITGSLVLGKKLSRGSRAGEAVGVMLPNSNAVVVTFFALQSRGLVPAMLNYSAGEKNLVSACRTAKLKRVITSRRFVTMAKLEKVAEALAQEVELVWLEDLKEEIGVADKLMGLVQSGLSGWLRLDGYRRAEERAVILFTSGSEGAPKGVVLSHKNLLANCCQLSSRVDYNATDIVFNALPVFHSFGLTGGTLLPIVSGIRTFLYPSPLHYRIVPEAVYDTNATILFGTDTFLSGYARMAHPYDFYSLRHVFAGAEKLRDQTRKVWGEKFGLRILEGYGATETGPALSLNTPMHYKPGTVGRLLPSIEHRLDPVPGIDAGGRLVVKGPNIMLGYLRADNPGVLEPPEQGEYDTGDIVEIDAEGYMAIRGRAKRFAKIAGEMVSLTAVESLAAELWPKAMHAVVTRDGGAKGEALVLVTTQVDAARRALMAHAKASGAAELMVPRDIRPIDKMPLLGTGKTDYPAVNAWVLGENR